MPNYLDIKGFIARFGEDEVKQIASNGLHNTKGGAQIDEVRVQAALDFARDMINARLLMRFAKLKTLETSKMPAMLAGFAGDIARYRLRNKAAQKSDAAELVDTRYKDALNQLDQLAKGQMSLLDADGKSLEAYDGAGAGGAGGLQTSGGIHFGQVPTGSSDTFLKGY